MLPQLTTRQERALALASEGLGVREIARRMQISPYTVRRHREAAVRNLGAVNLVHAAAIYASAARRPTRRRLPRGQMGAGL